MRKQTWHGLPARGIGSRAGSPCHILFLLPLVLIAAQAVSPQYQNDFEKADIGKVPDDIMVLDGTFAVRQLDGNRFLELAGDPIGAFGALFGPDGLTSADVQARIQAEPTAKRFPEFGIGTGGPAGWKLFLVPQTQSIELRKGDDTKVSAKYTWTPGSWTWFRLQVEPKDKTTWEIRGKVWRQGEPEPKEWTITATDNQTPPAGKASLWGSDFSEKPIRFDDLSAKPLPQRQ